MKGSWPARHHLECRDLTPPALAFPEAAVSHGLVSIKLPVPLLGSVHEASLASGVLGSVSLMLAFQAALHKALLGFLPQRVSLRTPISLRVPPNYWPLGSRITLASPSLP